MNLRDKKALVVGLKSSGLACAKALLKRGAEVIGSDSGTLEGTAERSELEALGVRLELGAPPDKLLSEVDLIVISPGVPIQSPFVAKAAEQGIELIGEVELAYRLLKAPIAAITGTNGKTTTTSLLGEMFKASGRRVFVAGNIGLPLISIVDEAMEDDIVVAEISSFQLESVKEFHPAAAALLNITPDHLDRHGTLAEYIRIKSRVFQNQNEDDYAVLPVGLLERFPEIGSISSKVLSYSIEPHALPGAYCEDGKAYLDLGDGKEYLIYTRDIRIKGAHNIENALAAALLARSMGVDVEAIRHTLISFPGVEHRYELVAERGGITFINDSKATNPDSTVKAVQSAEGPTALILGGYNKGVPLEPVFDAFNEHIEAIVTIGDTAEAFMAIAHERGFLRAARAKTLESAVKMAARLVPQGGVVLFSPACASFDMFRNFEERGRAFKRAVLSLEDSRD